MKPLFTAFVFFCLSIQLNVNAQIISTVAGNGLSGYNGDGGPATAAQLDYATGITVDVFGDIFIADQLNNRIRKVTPAGIITTVAGSGTMGYNGDGGLATAAELNKPTNVAVDGAGNLYIADAGNNCIRMVNPLGIITTLAGNGIAGYTGDGGPSATAELNLPQGIAVDGSGNLFIADYNNQVIRKVNPSHIITTVAGDGTSASGGVGDGGAATAAKLWFPIGVAVDRSGNLFIADYFNNSIRKVNTSGIITTVAGCCPTYSGGYSGDGGAAIIGKLNQPVGVTCDSFGNLFIADAGNTRIRLVNTSGIITTFAGNGIWGYSGDGGYATLAELAHPSGVTIDASSNLLIADAANNSIRKVSITSLGIKQTAQANYNLTLLPNPNKGTFVFTGLFNETEDLFAKVTNTLGQIVYINSFPTEKRNVTAEVRLNDLPDGIYTLHLTTATEARIARFIIEK